MEAMAYQGGTKSVRVPVLVKIKDAHTWLTRFLAFAVVERISAACQPSQDPDLPAREDTAIVEWPSVLAWKFL